MEEGEFDLIAQPESYWVSWITHTGCESYKVADRLDPDTRWCDLFGEVCPYCGDDVPQDLLGVWRLHNYDNYAQALRIRERSL